MFINPFWAGVIVTILVEVAALCVYAASTMNGKKN